MAGLAESLRGAQGRAPRILLRSSWQLINIGDVAHTPGVLSLLEKHIPQAEIRLWPNTLSKEVDAMLRRRFPKVTITDNPKAVALAFQECDFLLHGSGPSLVASQHVAKWRDETKKPYGIYGITVGTAEQKIIDLLSGAKFAFFRDSASLQLAKENGAKSPLMEFGPDGAFAVNLRDDASAIEFLRANNLEDQKFLCCIPRYRITPNWTIPSKKAPFNEVTHARNEAMKEHDHLQLRQAIIALTRKHGMKVLVCPEDVTQVALGKEMLVNPLPDDVRAKVVWRDHFWRTDEAVSTYIRSAGIFGNEMHSPIMCIGNGVPAIVCRWKEQTSKGIMWRDIGLGDWLFDLDNEKEIPGIVPAVIGLVTQRKKALQKVAAARALVERRQRETMAALRREL